jgi:hypothetical protein
LARDILWSFQPKIKISPQASPIINLSCALWRIQKYFPQKNGKLIAQLAVLIETTAIAQMIQLNLRSGLFSFT